MHLLAKSVNKIQAFIMYMYIKHMPKIIKWGNIKWQYPMHACDCCCFFMSFQQHVPTYNIKCIIKYVCYVAFILTEIQPIESMILYYIEKTHRNFNEIFQIHYIYKKKSDAISYMSMLEEMKGSFFLKKKCKIAARKTKLN